MEKHFAVSGFVVNQDCTKVLMIHHKKLNVWVIPGGHLEPNEFPLEGALREVREETGVDIKFNDSWLETLASGKEHQLDSPYSIIAEFIPAKGDKEAHIHIDMVFTIQADEQPLKGQETEVSDMKWMTKQEVLESNTFQSVKDMARKMLV